MFVKILVESQNGIGEMKKTPVGSGVFLNDYQVVKNFFAFSKYSMSSSSNSYSWKIASTGQTAWHAPQSIQISGSM